MTCVESMKVIRDYSTFLATNDNDMYEAEVLCDRTAFINRGRIVAIDAPERLKSITGLTLVEKM